MSHKNLKKCSFSENENTHSETDLLFQGYIVYNITVNTPYASSYSYAI